MNAVGRPPCGKHYVCEFGCRVHPSFKREVCPDFLVGDDGEFVKEPPQDLKPGDGVAIPMAWIDKDGVERDVERDDVPYCRIVESRLDRVQKVLLKVIPWRSIKGESG